MTDPGPSSSQSPDGGGAQSPPSGSRGLSVRQVFLVLAVVLPVLCVVMYYWPFVANWVLLERWSEAGPRSAVERTCQALSSNDSLALEQALGQRPDLTVVCEKDQIVAVKLGGGPAPPVGVWPLRSPNTQVRRIDYNLSGGSVTVHVQGDVGPEIVFGLRKVAGAWRIERIMGPPAPASEDAATTPTTESEVDSQ